MVPAMGSLSKAVLSLAVSLHEDIFSLYHIAVSNPLYLAYALFFSPHIISLLSFLSPLLLTTSILLLSFPCSATYFSLLGQTLRLILQIFREEEDPMEAPPREDSFLRELYMAMTSEMVESWVEDGELPLKILDSGKLMRKCASYREEEDAKGRAQKPSLGQTRNGSLNSTSMRVKKQWERTLAGKMKQDSFYSGDERMDLLWEAYELGSGRRLRERMMMEEEEDDGHDDDDDDGGKNMGRLCCLRALRIGLGRSNLPRISTAVRDVGALRRSFMRSSSMRV